MAALIMNVAIVGAGAMGCLFAARISEAGANVTLIDNCIQRLDQIEALGIELADDLGCRRTRPATALAGEFAGPVDLMILFTKSMHSASAVASVAHLKRQNPIALTLQNGLGNAEILVETFGGARVLAGTAHVPADLTPPNKVTSHGLAQIQLGGFRPESQGHSSAVADLLKRANFDPKVTADVQAAIWEKLAFNAALNAMAMITESTNGEMCNAHGFRIAKAVVAETVAVAEATGIRIDENQINAAVEAGLTGHPGHKASMLQDRELARPTEIEAINAKIAGLGRGAGISTPINDTLSDLVGIIERKARARG